VTAGVRVLYEDILANPQPEGCQAYDASLVRIQRRATPDGADYTVAIRNTGKAPCTLDGEPNISVDRVLNGLETVQLAAPPAAVTPAVLAPGQMGYVRLSSSHDCGRREAHDLDSLIFPDSYTLVVHIALDSGCPVGVSPWYRLGSAPPPLPQPGPGWDAVMASLDVPTEATARGELDYTLILRNTGGRDLDLNAYCPVYTTRFEYNSGLAIGTADDRRLNCAAVPGKLFRAHATLRFQMRAELDSQGSLRMSLSLVDLDKVARGRVHVTA
jgi:hypothetical protein